MPNKNNIWYRAFNNPKLEDEKWLDPTDALFARIEDEVYEKKKKRRGLVYWMMGLGVFIGLLSIAIIYNPLTSGASLSEASTIIDARNTAESQTVTKEENKNQASSATKEIVTENGLATNGKKGLIQERYIQKESQLESTNQEQVLPKTNGITSSSIVKKSSAFVNSPISRSDYLVTSQQLKTNNLGGNETVSAGFNISSIQKVNSITNGKKDLKKVIGLLSQLATPETSLLFFDRPFDLVLPDPFKPIEVLESSINNNILGFSIGLSQWNFALNNEYKSALDPADFTFDNGRGWNAGFSYQRSLSSKFAVYTLTQVEKIKLTSGHNSSVNYDINQGANGENVNDIDLTMASPLGFLESNLIINRGSDASQNDLDLVLDLHNEHHITNLSFVTGLEYALLKSNIINISATSGVGLNYFSSVRNELSSFDIDRVGYMSGVTRINKNPEKINKVTPFVDFGIVLNKEFATSWNTGFSVGYRKTVSPIYSEGDFATRLSGVNVRWLITRSF